MIEYRIVEVKWAREGNFQGTPPITQGQLQISGELNRFVDEGWDIVDIHHDVGEYLRFSIITLSRKRP